MDGALAVGLITAGTSVGVNAVGWVIILLKSSRQEAKFQGSLERALADICKDVDYNKASIKETNVRIDGVKDKLTDHIVKNHRRYKK